MFGYSMYESIPMRRFERSSIDKLPTQRRAPQRDRRTITRTPVGGLTETLVKGRRRVYDQIEAGQKAALDARRVLAPMSVLADRIPMPEKAVAAKAIAADRRFYHPEWPYAPPLTAYGTPARFGVAALSAHNQLRDVMRFYKSLTVVPCIQRAVRREVLFATGQHGAHHSKRRKGPFSNMRC